MGRVVHFEIFSEEPQRLVDFYREAFGWDISGWEGPFEYHLASTGPEGEPGIDGAIAPPAAGEQRVVLTIAVDDAEAAIEAVRNAGGALVQGKQAVPGVGWHAYLTDPAGIVFGVMQDDPTAGLEAAEVAAQAARATAEEASRADATDAWNDVGERLRELGASVARAFGETASSPQAQRVREEADRAASSIRQASAATAERASPYVVSALDRVSRELDDLAVRLRRERQEPEAPVVAEEPAPEEDEGCPEE